MVSNLAFSCEIVHVGVMRRSVRKTEPCSAELLLLLPPAELGEVIMTETSVGVGWNAAILIYGC